MGTKKTLHRTRLQRTGRARKVQVQKALQIGVDEIGGQNGSKAVLPFTGVDKIVGRSSKRRAPLQRVPDKKRSGAVDSDRSHSTNRGRGQTAGSHKSAASLQLVPRKKKQLRGKKVLHFGYKKETPPLRYAQAVIDHEGRIGRIEASTPEGLERLRKRFSEMPKVEIKTPSSDIEKEERAITTSKKRRYKCQKIKLKR